MPSPVPGLPNGQSVATYDKYADAQRAVDYLSDQKFPVQQLAIVGTDLKQIERVTGRLSWGKAILGGLLAGAWFGLLLGLLFGLFTNEGWGRLILFCIVYTAVFGAILGAVSYAFTGGRRDFTSATATIAGKYEIYAGHQVVDQARQLLSQLSMQGTGTITPQAATAAPAAAPPTTPPTA